MTTSNSTAATDQSVTLERAARRDSKRRIRRIATVATAVVAAFVTLTMQASPASAWMRTASSGRPGQVGAPRVDVTNYWTSYGGGCYGTHGCTSSHGEQVIRFQQQAGFWVGRSPASPSGSQRVDVLYTLQKWHYTGSWEDVLAMNRSATIGNGRASVGLPSASFETPQAQGHYRVVLFVNWSVSGRNVGAAIVEPHTTTDHRCVTNLCTADNGAFVTFADRGGVSGHY